MILSDRDIFKEIDAGNIICSPFEPKNVSNSSLDLRLGRWIEYYEPHRNDKPVKISIDRTGKLTVLNAHSSSKFDLLQHFDYKGDDLIKGTKYTLIPDEFILAQTLEIVGHPHDRIISQVLDKSTLARLGISVCFSAGYIDAGNVLSITLEIKNNGNRPVELQYGMHIAQLKFQYLSSPCLNKYNGKYLNSHTIQSAK